MLLTTGERISIALVSMAINDLGHEAVSFTGSQAGIVTDTSHGKARIVEMRRGRVHEALDDGEDRDRRRLPGRLDDAGRDDARARRLRHDRGRARRGAPGRRLRDLHRRRRRLHAPTRASSRTRASSTRSPTRRCSSWRRAARACSRCARSSTLVTTASRSTSARRSPPTEGTWIIKEEDMLEQAIISGIAHDTSEAKVTILAVPGQAGRRRPRLPAARRRRDQHRHDRPELVGVRAHRHLLHRADERARTGRADPREPFRVGRRRRGSAPTPTSPRSRSSAPA